MRTRPAVVAALGLVTFAALGKELICDTHNWISCCTFSGTLLPGTELPGQVPALATTGIVWAPDHAYEFVAGRGPTKTVDALTLSYAQGVPVSHSNYAFSEDNRVVEIPFLSPVYRPHMSIAGYTALDGPLHFEMTYKVPHVAGPVGQTIIEYVVGNNSPAPVANVSILRSLNPKIQVDDSIPIEILSMDLVANHAAMGVHPSGATIIMWVEGGVASVEGDIVLDPNAILGSPRDPNGLQEDTAINLAFGIPQLVPGQVVAFRMFIVTAADPLTAIDVMNMGGFPFCLPDCEGDGDLDVFDFLCFQNAFALLNPYADFEGDGDWDVFDFLAFQNQFAGGCG